MSFGDVAIVYFKENDSRIHFWHVSKDEAINLLKNTDSILKKENLINHKYLLSHIKSVKRLLRLVILKLENINFTKKKVLFQFLM